MSPLKMGSRTAPGISAEQLAAKAETLLEALEAGGPQLDPELVSAAADVIAKFESRTSIAGGHTVVALAGATGSGKSSLFNALVGSDVATIGARRPTTALPSAAIWGEESASELLDWLKVAARHHVEGPTAATDGGPAGRLDGLVLLDLPDFDSRVVEHRVEAERVLDLVDVFVWVTDPQKYADARLHTDYLTTLATHDAVTVIVLNQADRLTADQLEECRSDLARLAAADGVGSVQVIATSARTGRGLDDLRHRLASAVAGQNASRFRLAADVRAAAGRLRAGVADQEPSLAEKANDELVDALSRAAGLPTVVAAVERDYRREAWARTGWPFTRWVRAFRPDPLKRLRLDKARPDGVTEADVRGVLGRSSLPPPTPAARSAVALATRKVGDAAGDGLPVRWSEAAADAATPHGPDLADALDQAVIGTPLRARDPLWWTVVGLLQLFLAGCAVAGFLWLAVLAVMGWLQLPEIESPRLGVLPYPFVLLVGGLLLGLLLAAVARSAARIGARRRGRVIGRRLRDAVSGIATERIIAPVRAVLARHATARAKLDDARS